MPRGIGAPIPPHVIAGSGSISVWAGTSSLALENLSEAELNIFYRDIYKIAGHFALSRDLQSIFLEDIDVYLYAAAIAKKQLNAGFGGATPGSGEIGMQLIRSKTIGKMDGGSTRLAAANWLQTIAAAGWNNIFGSSSDPVDLSSTSTNYGNTQNRVCVVFPKFLDICAPKLTEAYFKVGPTDYPIFPLGFFGMSDLYIARLPAAVFAGVNGKFYMRGNIIGNGVVEGIVPLGLTFAKAEYMVGSGQE